MSYVALYRKWRPDTFDEVKGQDHIVTTLKNQIKNERTGHAYMFCGTRGTGKTTLARIVAKAVNCEHPSDGNPCNECASCKAISAGNSMNVIEIDAASNNGVDNIRQINNAVQYSPTNGKYLVYIIDEAHMLHRSAANALLKTLEEPPEYVIFILATTEYNAIPVTIMSRCQRYDFKRISNEIISARLMDLLSREEIEADEDAVSYIAKAADGSMRDGLSILDQCIAFNLGERLTYDKVIETIGAVDIDIYIKLLSAVEEQRVKDAIEIVDSAIYDGKDLSQFLGEFITFIRNVLMLKLDPSMRMDMTSENVKRCIEIGKAYEMDYLINDINILQDAANKIKYASVKKVVLEVAIIKLCKPVMQDSLEALTKRVDALEANKGLADDAGSVSVSSEEQQGVSAADMEALEKRVYEKIASELGDGSSKGYATKQEYSNPFSKEEVLANIQRQYPDVLPEEMEIIAGQYGTILEGMMHMFREKLADTYLMPTSTTGTFDLVVNASKLTKFQQEYFTRATNINAIQAEMCAISGRDIKINVNLKTDREGVSNAQRLDIKKLDEKFNQKIKLSNVIVEHK